jgi:ribosomal protein S18 acetylase RimI-like enzyme
MKIKKIIIKTYVNPSCTQKKPFDDFLNNGNNFDVLVDSYPNKEIYYVGYIGHKIIAVRKVLTGFQEYFEHTKWYNRFKEYVDKNQETYYLQAIAVKSDYQNQGIGSSIMELTMKNMPKDIKILSSLMSSNTLRKKYSNHYGFIELEEKENRILISKNIIKD